MDEFRDFYSGRVNRYFSISGRIRIMVWRVSLFSLAVTLCFVLIISFARGANPISDNPFPIEYFDLYLPGREYEPYGCQQTGEYYSGAYLSMETNSFVCFLSDTRLPDPRIHRADLYVKDGRITMLIVYFVSNTTRLQDLPMLSVDNMHITWYARKAGWFRRLFEAWNLVFRYIRPIRHVNRFSAGVAWEGNVPYGLMYINHNNDVLRNAYVRYITWLVPYNAG